MLSKNRRISREEFPYILKNAKRYNSPSLLLYVAPTDSNNSKESKFSFSVSKKVCPKAVDRNRFRRWGYSAVRGSLKQVCLGYFCFFSFKKTLKPVSFSVVEKEVRELLSLSGVLR